MSDPTSDPIKRKQELPTTDVDDFGRYRWEWSSAVRPEWDSNKDWYPLFREVYFGYRCLAEPAHAAQVGPPYIVCSFPSIGSNPGSQKVYDRHLGRKEARRKVRALDRPCSPGQQELFGGSLPKIKEGEVAWYWRPSGHTRMVAVTGKVTSVDGPTVRLRRGQETHYVHRRSVISSQPPDVTC